MTSKTAISFAAVMIAAAAAGTVARKVEALNFDTLFMLSTVALVIAGTVGAIRFIEWRFAVSNRKNPNKVYDNRPRTQL